MMSGNSRVVGSLFLVACSLFSSVAAAQEEGGFALNQLQPSPAGDAFFGVPSPYAAGHLDVRAYIMLDYAHRPIRLASNDVAVVSAQGFLRADLSLAVWNRLLVSVDMPMSIVQKGEDPAIDGLAFTPADSPEPGDLRIGARGRIWGDDAGPFQIGIGSYLFAPTGTKEQYTGEGAVRGAFHLALGGRVGPRDIAFIYGAAGGVELRASDSPHAITYGGGAGITFVDDMVQLGPELYGVSALGGDVALSSVPVQNADAGTNLELLLGAKVRFLRGLTLGGGAGPGLLSAIGTPTLRALVSLGWTPPPEASGGEKTEIARARGDKDGDGTPDDIDACPEKTGEPNPDPKLDGCPPPDGDGDGILDGEDACPTSAGRRNVELTANGCPPDSDGDGFHDGIDACPTKAGDASEDPKLMGCPGDRDGDGIADLGDACPEAAGDKNEDPRHHGCPADPDGDGILFASDACPFERGATDPDPAQSGCPRFVRVSGDEIVIKQKIEFTSYGAHLSEAVTTDSAQTLTEVKDVILGHPEYALVEVQGHTDDTGNEAFNQDLSQRRAETVMKWLVEHGVAKERLVAKGYGYTRPSADNRIWTGRQANRRVQFVIVRQNKR